MHMRSFGEMFVFPAGAVQCCQAHHHPAAARESPASAEAPHGAAHGASGSFHGSSAVARDMARRSSQLHTEVACWQLA